MASGGGAFCRHNMGRNSNDCLQPPDRSDLAVLAGAANEVEDGKPTSCGCPRTHMG